MKKVVFLLVILLAVTGATFAQSAASALSAIPAASYEKGDDGATWTFSTSGIDIVAKNGERGSIPISGIKDVTGSGTTVSFSYATDENNRTYRLGINVVSGAITLDITRNGVAYPQTSLTKK